MGASLSVAETLASGDTAGYARADTVRAFGFPADHGPHPEFRHEWWYFTGNLRGGDGRRFGFHLTIFRNALRPDSATVGSPWATRQAYMGHLAMTDVREQRLHAFERFERGALGLAGARADPLRVWIGDWAIEAGDPAGGEAAIFRVEAVEAGTGVRLTLRPTDPPVLQGDRGLSRKGPEPGNASYYYSLPRLDAVGTVVLEGREHPVWGTAWLDREWGTSALGPELEGWDWFALQLTDGSELMYYRLRRRDGGTDTLSAGTWVAPDGRVVALSPETLVLEEPARWTSPRGGSYPGRWRLRVPSLDLVLEVRPVVADQELDLAFRYWEGAVDVAGSRGGRPLSGVGYVELTGYADAP